MSTWKLGRRRRSPQLENEAYEKPWILIWCGNGWRTKWTSYQSPPKKYDSLLSLIHDLSLFFDLFFIAHLLGIDGSWYYSCIRSLHLNWSRFQQWAALRKSSEPSPCMHFIWSWWPMAMENVSDWETKTHRPHHIRRPFNKRQSLVRFVLISHNLLSLCWLRLCSLLMAVIVLISQRGFARRNSGGHCWEHQSVSESQRTRNSVRPWGS